jgi:flagellar assembly protein FliH
MQAQAVETLDRLSQLKENFEQQLANAHHEIGEELLKLAIDLASAMTKTEFNVHPEAILPVVHEAIELLPSIHQPAHLVLHPDDALIIKELMGERLERESWRIINDSGLTRGGCRIETAQNLVDATYETRWSRLSDALTGSQQTRTS